MLLSGGMMEKKAFNVSSPPAEAPIPTMGKRMPSFEFFSCLTFFKDFFFGGGAFFFFVGMVVAFIVELMRKNDTLDLNVAITYLLHFQQHQRKP